MNRRSFLAGIGALVASPVASEAQQAGKAWRVGVLAGSVAEGSRHREAFLKELRERGYAENRDILIEWRSGDSPDQFAELAAEMVRLKVDVIVAGPNAAVAAAQSMTRTIPIVMVFATDPVALGFVTSLSHPGGNITGLSAQSLDITRKRLQLLKETIPKLSRVGVLWDPTDPGRQQMVTETEVASAGLRVGLQLVEARLPSELDRAFAAMTRDRTGALLVVPSAMLFSQRARIDELAAENHLATMCAWLLKTRCLMNYTADSADLTRRAAYFVDKILKGAKPAELPVEQPTKFELVINLKTAKALGLTIPPSLLLRADQVIE